MLDDGTLFRLKREIWVSCRGVCEDWDLRSENIAWPWRRRQCHPLKLREIFTH